MILIILLLDTSKALPVTPGELNSIMQQLARGENQNRITDVNQFLNYAILRNSVYYPVYDQNGNLVQQQQQQVFFPNG